MPAAPTHMSAPQTSIALLPTTRMAGFINHLRLNKFALGPAETELALRVIAAPLTGLQAARQKLKILLTGCKEEWQQFDELFEAYWLQAGKEKTSWRAPHSRAKGHKSSLPKAWQNHFTSGTMGSDEAPQLETEGEREAEGSASGRLIATEKTNYAKTDLRQFSNLDEIRAAEALAWRLASAMRYRLSRRHKISKRARKLDLRRTIRASLAFGGEPFKLRHQARPDRPVRLVVFLDVSGSMKHYSRFFLQFVKGLVCQWLEADAYLVHTRLIRVTDAIRDKNSIKAMTKLSLMAEGFGGGTRLGESLAHFNAQYAKHQLNSRTVVMILSDGYDTGVPEKLAEELRKIRKRAPKLIWLNPLLGWKNYEPVTKAMQAAQPYITYFAAANTLESLAAIESEIAAI